MCFCRQLHTAAAYCCIADVRQYAVRNGACTTLAIVPARLDTRAQTNWPRCCLLQFFACCYCTTTSCVLM